MVTVKDVIEYFRGFSKSQRYRTISTHPKASQRYAKEFQKFVAVRQKNQNFEVPKPKLSFTDKFMKKFQ
jgi:hypothetical protein